MTYTRKRRVGLLLFTLASTLEAVASFSGTSARKHLFVACFAPVSPSCSHRTSSCGPIFVEKENGDEEGSEVKSAVEEELESLQNQLALIEALEERNKSQLDSFVDEQDQWESLEEEERQLLQQKGSITQRMEMLAEELVQIWMGAKSMDG